ncbi:RHS repeat domain-containing protein [Cysteiniphilum halobium]|uniref:RHS repeat domain-containing protein n=1 Tax=Cysteiniphilum halobium TaxID=2219059 RepID=UPI000E657E6A|nr:RHS repeat domain-containing protein [Cysteiniphilum halobium]
MRDKRYKTLCLLTAMILPLALTAKEITHDTNQKQLDKSDTKTDSKIKAPQKVSLFAGDSSVPVNPLGTVSNENRLLHILPENGNKVMQVPLVSIPLDDGLTFNYSLFLKLSSGLYYNYLLAIFPHIASFDQGKNPWSGSSQYGLTYLMSSDGNLVNFITPKTGGSGLSTSHFSGVSKLYSTNIYDNNGVQYYQYDSGYEMKAVINSSHHKSSITYNYQKAYGNANSPTWKVCDGESQYLLKTIELSNNYKLSFNYYANEIYYQNGDHDPYYVCTQFLPSNVSDSYNRHWTFQQAGQYHEQQAINAMTLPDGTKLTTGYGDLFHASSSIDVTGLTYSGLNSSSITYSGANLSTNETETYSVVNGNHIITHTDGSKDIYHYIASTNGELNNNKGAYDKHLIEDKNGKVYYDEENTWTNISGVPVLTKQTITQDGVTTSKVFSDFNSFLYPQTIVETASNGETRTTKSTYFVLEASSTHGHMVKPATVIVTDSAGKVVQSVVNTYDTEGYLTTSTVNGVTTTYSYDAKGNIASETDASGNKTQYLNYVNGQPQTVIDPNGNSTTYTYDYRGLVLTKTDAKGNVTKYSYDVMDRLTSVIPPIGNTVTYTYTNHGLTVTKTQGQAVTTTNYDGFGRVINSTVSDSNPADTIAKVNKYDPVNNRRFASYPCRNIAQCTVGDIYTNDVLNRPIQLVKDTTSF